MDQARLKELLHYDEETGQFTRLKTRGRGKKKCLVGRVAGCISNDGYRHIAVDGRRYLAHRLAWLYVHGVFPVDQLDHINCVRDDNRIANLRLATQSQNNANMRVPSHNTSGVKGVYWHKGASKWMAYITANRQRRYLGLFTSIDAAAAAYATAACSLFGEYARGA